MNILDYNTPAYIGKWDYGHFEELSSDSGLWELRHKFDINEFQIFVEHQEENLTMQNEDRIWGFIRDYYGKSIFEGHIDKITRRIIFSKQYDKEAIKRGAYKGVLFYDGLIKKISEGSCYGEYISGLITGENNHLIKSFIMKKRR